MSQVGLVQMNSGKDPLKNLSSIYKSVLKLTTQGANWIVLPENALVLGCKEDYHAYAETLGQGALQQEIMAMAKAFKIWIIIGSFPIKTQNGITTSTLVINAQGELDCHYDKIHLFDAYLDGADKNKQIYQESNTFIAGNQLKVATTPFGQLGLTICYDLRFPLLYQALRQNGAQIILVPAAFTYQTGKAHWQALLQARAIETQCFIVAVGQTGEHDDGRTTWGHSMVINPWGKIIASLSKTQGSLIANIDLKQLDDVRKKIPMFHHQRLQIEKTIRPILKNK